MRINTNISAMNTYGRLTNANASKSESLSKLSSGLRINKAGDDAAGLAISEKMKGQVGGLNQAVRNAQDGVSLIQTAEGALNETHAILGRMRDLAVQGANGTLSQDDRVEINKEFDALKTEITRISDTTEFNTKKLLNTEGQNFTFQIGANGGQTMSVTIGKMDSTTLGLKDAKLSGNESEDAIRADKVYTDAESRNQTAQAATIDPKYLTDGKMVSRESFVGAVNTAQTAVDKLTAQSNLRKASTTPANFDDVIATADAGTTINSETELVTYLTGTSGSTTAMTTEVAEAFVANLQTAKVPISYGTTTLGDLKSALTAITDPTAALVTANGTLTDAKTDLTGYTDAQTKFEEKAAAAANLKSAKTQALDSLGRAAASDAIKNIDDAIKSVSAQRSDLGAAQNRLGHTVKNLTTTKENLAEANSRIRDVDMAEEMMSFTKSNILSQAATSMLSQANAMPNSVLGLLQG